MLPECFQSFLVTRLFISQGLGKFFLPPYFVLGCLLLGELSILLSSGLQLFPSGLGLLFHLLQAFL